jgi:NAD(P)H dehydrogenase (quinone)
MTISVILAHPNQGSFNHSIACTAVQQLESNGHEVSFHDLYMEKFDPIMPGEEINQDAQVPGPVMMHCREIAEAQGIVIVHPNWWGQPPAILKGWADRVLRPGIAYDFVRNESGEWVPRGLLKAEMVVVLTTSNTTPETEIKLYGDPLETIWRNCIFGFCGVTSFYRKNFGVIIMSRTDQRRQWLDEVKTTIEEFFPANQTPDLTSAV